MHLVSKLCNQDSLIFSFYSKFRELLSQCLVSVGWPTARWTLSKALGCLRQQLYTLVRPNDRRLRSP